MNRYRELYGRGDSLSAYQFENTLSDLNTLIQGNVDRELPEMLDYMKAAYAKQCKL